MAMNIGPAASTRTGRHPGDDAAAGGCAMQVPGRMPLPPHPAPAPAVSSSQRLCRGSARHREATDGSGGASLGPSRPRMDVAAAHRQRALQTAGGQLRPKHAWRRRYRTPGCFGRCVRVPLEKGSAEHVARRAMPLAAYPLRESDRQASHSHRIHRLWRSRCTLRRSYLPRQPPNPPARGRSRGYRHDQREVSPTSRTAGMFEPHRKDVHSKGVRPQK